MRVEVDDVLAAVDRVVDPCSAAMGVPVGLHDLGLVVDVQPADDRITVRLRLTSPCCAYGPQLAAAVAAEIAALPGHPVADVTIDHASMWTPAMMSATATDALAARRRRTLELTALEPYDWSGRVST